MKISSEEILRNIQLVNNKYLEILSYFFQNKINFLPTNILNSEQINLIFAQIIKQINENPQKFFNIGLEYGLKIQELIHNVVTSGDGHILKELQLPTARDKRFADPLWKENIYFNFIHQFYLISADYIKKYMREYQFDNQVKKYLDFQINQFIYAFSPSNFIFANPVVLKEVFESGWQNIIKGFDNLLHDIKNSENIFTIPIVNKAYFEVGRNLASSKGKIVMQNELIQLICYEPKETAYAIPLLVVPPWINKYYILDLSANNSLTKFLTEQNFQIFTISWINPDSRHSNKDFEDYLKEGVIEAVSYIINLGFTKVNTVGYCIGGTLLACAVAYFKAKKLNYINSSTFLATLLDFSSPGEIDIFINDFTIKALEQQVEKAGYFDGRYLSNSFNILRANDLIWSFFINNYLLGKAPLAFDLLYWNADYTNLPAKMYIYYLKNMYLSNLLACPERLTMLNTSINLKLIDCPSFFVATSSDHIAPWEAVFKSHTLLSGEKTFCLANSGHVAGIINPPCANKYGYKTNKLTKANQSSSNWLETSKNHEGSWWNYWTKWLIEHSELMNKAIDYDKLSFIESAPGSYCLKKI